MNSAENHPNIHAAWAKWSEEQVLHVVAAYINPYRWNSRRRLAHDFRRHMEHAPNVRLHMVEVAFGERPFELTSPDNPDDIQLRTSHSLWLKENVLNIAIRRLHENWKYAAIIDADFTMTRHDWALEGIHKLQHHPWVQLFSSYAVQGPTGRPTAIRPSFAYAYDHYFDGQLERHKILTGGQPYTPDPGKVACSSATRSPGATGGAWAFTREAYEAVGGLLETCVLGAGDWHMAFGLVGNPLCGHEVTHCGDAYRDSIQAWQEKAFAAVRGNIGYVDGLAMHGWHGDGEKRGYGYRWKMLKEHAFDPAIDLIRDDQG